MSAFWYAVLFIGFVWMSIDAVKNIVRGQTLRRNLRLNALQKFQVDRAAYSTHAGQQLAFELGAMRGTESLAGIEHIIPIHLDIDLKNVIFLDAATHRMLDHMHSVLIQDWEMHGHPELNSSDYQLVQFSDRLGVARREYAAMVERMALSAPRGLTQ